MLAGAEGVAVKEFSSQAGKPVPLIVKADDDYFQGSSELHFFRGVGQ